MRRPLAALMVFLWCIGMADALGHAHVWAKGPDGQIRIAHAGGKRVFGLEAVDLQDRDLPGAHAHSFNPGDHAHHLAVSVWSDVGTMPSASAVPLPSQSAVSPPLIVVALAPPPEMARARNLRERDP